MPNVRVQSTSDGPQITVQAMVKDPLYIPSLVLQDIDQMFLAEQILRSADRPAGGSIVYYESTPLFADSPSEYVEEFGEIPVSTTSVGTPRPVRTRKRALGVRVSQEMIDRNQVDRVNVQISQVRNTLVRDFDTMFFQAILAATNVGLHTLAAATPWAGSTSTIRRNVLNAVKLVTDEKRGFIPDTLVINPTSRIDIMASSEMQQIYVGNVADRSPLITGRVDGFSFAGLDVWQTYAMPAGQALVTQRKVVGGFADERPLQATPLYVSMREAETYRSDTLRTSALFVDQPLSSTLLSGV